MGIKKIRQPKRNTPVFAIGAAIAAQIVAAVLFFFSTSLYTAPESRPAAAPFASTVMIVPGTFTAKNALASPDASTVTPKTSPSHAPAPIP